MIFSKLDCVMLSHILMTCIIHCNHVLTNLIRYILRDISQIYRYVSTAGQFKSSPYFSLFHKSYLQGCKVKMNIRSLGSTVPHYCSSLTLGACAIGLQ